MILFGGGKKACIYCGASFVPKHPLQRFCSETHRFRFNSRNYKRRQAAKKPRWMVRFCLNKKCRIRFSIDCRGKGHKNRRYCTIGCAKRERWRRWYQKSKARKTCASV